MWGATPMMCLNTLFLLASLCGAPRGFVAESFALTAANVADGFATARDSHVGLMEASFPVGSRGFLGRYPSGARYALVMGTEQAITEVACYRLERSRVRALRFTGHALMWSGVSVHLSAAIWDRRLQVEIERKAQ